MRNISFAILFLVTAQTVLSQCIYEDEMIASIRKKYQIINKQRKDYQTIGYLKSKVHTEDDEPDRKSYDSAFFDNGRLRLVIKFQSDSYWSSNTYLTEYYYWDDKVFFVYRRSVSVKYTDPDCDSNKKCAQGQEERFYYCNNMCVRYLKRQVTGTEKTIYSDLKMSADTNISCYDLKEDIVAKANEAKNEMISNYKQFGPNGR